MVPLLAGSKYRLLTCQPAVRWRGAAHWDTARDVAKPRGRANERSTQTEDAGCVEAVEDEGAGGGAPVLRVYSAREDEGAGRRFEGAPWLVIVEKDGHESVAS